MPPGGDHDGQIAQVLIKLGELGTQVAVVAAKQDNLKDQIDRLPLADHEARLRALERFKWMLAGASLLGGALAGSIVELLIHFAHG